MKYRKYLKGSSLKFLIREPLLDKSTVKSSMKVYFLRIEAFVSLLAIVKTPSFSFNPVINGTELICFCSISVFGSSGING